MSVPIHQHVFPIIDALVKEALIDMTNDNIKISCKNGCAHCCHLLVEVSMEEAQALATWVYQQTPARQAQFIANVKANADDAKVLFSKSRRNKGHVGAMGVNDEISDACYDAYFYKKKRPCPFLENNSCQAYEVRPSSCRLHMVSSPADLCRQDIDNDDEYEVPERIEELRNEFAPINSAVSKDGRWGHLGILVEIALEELDPKKKKVIKKKSA